MALEVGSIFARLGARLDDDGFDRFDRRLDKARNDARRDVVQELRADADTRGFDRYNRAARDVDRTHNDLVRGSGRLKTSMGALFVGGAGVAGAGIALGVLAKAGFGAVKAFEESNAIARRTDAVLKSTGGTAGVTAKEVSSLAEAIAAKTGIDDEAIQSGENLLLTFTNVRNEAGKGNDIFTQATHTLTDMSAALGQDTKSSAIQLGKALNDPIKGVTALSRVGVSFTAQQKEQIKTLVESGKTTEAQKLILAELGKEFGGAAEASATASGKLSVAWGNLQEKVGGALAPAFGKAADAVSGFLTDLTNGEGSAGKFGDTVARVAGKIGDVLGDIADAGARAFDWLRNNKDVQGIVQNLGRYFGLIADAAGDVGRAIGQAFGSGSGAGQSLKQIVAFVLRVQHAFSDVFIAVARRAIPGITGALKGLIDVVRGVVDVVAGILTGDFGKAWDGVKRIVSGAVRAVGGLIRAMTAPFREVVSRVGRLAGDIADKALDAGKGLVRGIIRHAKDLPGDLWSAIRGAAGRVGRLAGDLADKAADAGRGLVRAVVNRAKNLPGDLWDAIKAGVSKIGQLERDGAEAAVRAGRAIVNGVVNRAKDLPGDLLSIGKRAVSSLGRGLAGIGGAIVNALKSGGGFFADAGRGIADWINAHTPFGDKVKVGPVSVRLPALAQGGRVGPDTGGARIFIAGEGNADEWVISQEGDRRKNVAWAREALETLTGRRVLMHRGGKGLGTASANVGAGERGIKTAQAKIEALERNYARADRTFNLTDEELITEDADGNAILDPKAIDKRAGELGELRTLRDEIKRWLGILVARIKHLRAALKTAAGRYRKAASKSGKSKASKARAARYRERAQGYDERRSDLTADLNSAGEDFKDAGIDLSELDAEIASVRGTTAPAGEAAAATADPTLDTSLTAGERGAAGGFDRRIAEAGMTPDTADDEAARAAARGFWQGVYDRLVTSGASDAVITEAANRVAGLNPAAAASATGTTGGAAELAAAVIAQVGALNASRADLFGQFGGNTVAAGASPFATELGQSAGVRFYGAGPSGAGVITGAGGTPIEQTVIFTGPQPADPHTFTQAALHELKAAV